MSKLRLGNSCLYHIPDMSALVLDELELQGNHIRSLNNLPLHLKSLNVEKNSLINDGIFFPFPLLQTLNLSHNRINVFEEDDFVACYPSLITLDFSYNCLKQIGFLHELNLEKLDVSHNRIQLISGLPQSIKELNASSNEISMVQSKLPAHLEFLDLSYNSLRYAGLSLNWPTALRELHLDHNTIERFPRKLPDSLEVLTLSRNRITELPAKLPESLLYFIASSNKIRFLPDYKHHKKFKMFLIDDNCLTEIPANFQAFVFTTDNNWQQEKHHVAQKLLKKCWKRYVLTLRLRHLRRTKRVQEELFIVSMMPERWEQVDVIDPVWFRRSQGHSHIGHH